MFFEKNQHIKKKKQLKTMLINMREFLKAISTCKNEIFLYRTLIYFWQIKLSEISLSQTSTIKQTLSSFTLLDILSHFRRRE